MDFITASELASIQGCTKRNIVKHIQKGNIKARRTLNKRNCAQYEIPIYELPADVQAKIYQHKGVLKKEVQVNKQTPLDNYNEKEREEIALWKNIIEEWQTARMNSPIASKMEFDKNYIGVLKIQYPNLRFSTDILYKKLRALKNNDLDGLLDKRGKYRKGKTKIDDETWQVFLSFYLDQNQHPIRKCYEYTKMWLKQNRPELVADIPDYTTFTRHIKTDIPEAVETLGRYGEKVYLDRCAPYIRREYEGMRSNEWWIADNHTFDIISQTSDGKPHRLYLTAFYDARSEIFTGLYITNTPSSQSTLIALRNGIMKYGIPENIYVDNGREFLTFDVGGLGHRKKKNDNRFDPPPVFERLGIKMTNALVRNAKAKIIERRFLDVKNGISKLFATYTGGTVVERPEKLKFEIKNGNIVVDEELTNQVTELLEGYFNFSKYNGAVVADHGKRRIDVFNNELLVKRTASEADLNLMLLRSARAQKVTRRGVHLDINGTRLDYWNYPLLESYLGKQVYFRYDPKDLSKVRIYDLEDRYVMDVSVDNQTILKYGADTEDVKNAMSIMRKIHKADKTRYRNALHDEINSDTARDLLLMEAKANLASPATQASNLKDIEIQRANEMPLLHEITVRSNIDRMLENAEKKRKIGG